MLSGVQQDLAMLLAKQMADRRSLDELRPGADDGEDLQKLDRNENAVLRAVLGAA